VKVGTTRVGPAIRSGYERRQLATTLMCEPRDASCEWECMNLEA
jgi:hypothetical protein